MSFGNIFILGDSYSTFEGWIPEGYGCHYTSEGVRMVDGKSVDETEKVCKVEHTWWHMIATETGSSIITNNSCGGSTICNTGYGNQDATHYSFITRLDNFIKDGFFEKNTIDTLFVFGGTNDSWAGVPIGEPKFADWTEDDLYKAMPAFCYLLARLCEKLPDTRVLVLINTGLEPEFEEKYIEICKKYDIEFVKFSDIHKWDGHPTLTGMKQIKEQIIQTLLK